MYLMILKNLNEYVIKNLKIFKINLNLNIRYLNVCFSIDSSFIW